MSRRALILDGLWYSLCPSFTQLAISRPALLSRPRKQSSRPRSPPAIRIAAAPSRRCYSSNTSRLRELGNVESNTATEYSRNSSTPDVEPRSPSDEHFENPRRTGTAENEEDLEGSEPWKGTARVYRVLEEKPKSYLEAYLQRDKTPNIQAATQVLRALIRDQHVQPRARHYKALIRANSDSVRGSPDAVRGLLEEMEANDIAADSGTLHAALQVSNAHGDRFS